MTPPPARIALAEDSALLREGLLRLLGEAGFEVVGSHGDGASLLAALDAEAPDAVVLDVRMPPTFTDEGVRTALEVRRRRPGTAVLLLSQYVESVYAQELFAAGEGGCGYLLKDRVLSLADLSGALERLLAGSTVLDPEIVAALVGARRDPLAALTPSELEVLGDMARGRTNQEIAAARVVSLGTVEKQVGSVFDKLGLDAADGGHRRVLAVLTWLRSPHAAR
ncbi:MAG: response regulator transcription factor [Salana multivorans]|uniref:response regulator n=1 Tax=Salana multivorans TaxID=120377 RepID=UPI00096923FC|nr:response regulator transcription factor [Salana multivorans]MBN8882850.1 response regulator transcription factor [Salana multivorans]OJX97946.1 MAG: DNA-binding response regulator [Micrococcales bacterium 73-15]